jgi:hypothetical protein
MARVCSGYPSQEVYLSYYFDHYRSNYRSNYSPALGFANYGRISRHVSSSRVALSGPTQPAK